MAVAVTLWGVAALLGIAVLGVAVQRMAIGSRLIYLACLLTCLAILFAACTELLAGAGHVESLRLPVGLPWIGAHFVVDALAAFFLAVVNLAGAAASLYALGYGEHEKSPGRVLPFYPAFLAGMNLVIVAADAFSFLFAWEFMSLTSWLLVMTYHQDPDNRRAGYIYIVMASFGTLALLLAFGLLAGPTGGYAFADIRGVENAGWHRGLILALVLLGAGSKAGLVPLHVWLPLAHPAAPSHVSALMSGAMTKVAIYGFIRIIFDLLGSPVWWWGSVVLVLGSVTAVLGVLFATMQRDFKRLLAYSTVENVGIIFVGLGLALAFKANGMTAAAAVAFSAALFHVLNHALFKNLLFFGAGAVLGSTGARDIERLGGLIHRMPWTAFAFLGGCVAISALPPLNGFVSEWLVFQAVLLSPDLPQWGLRLLVPAAGAMLALGAALSAACFVRAYGITFLGRPRSDAATYALETDAFSLAAMAILLCLCLLAGILPGFIIDAMAPLAQNLVGQRMPQQASLPWLSIVPLAESRSSYNGLLVFAFIAMSAVFAAEIIHRFASRAVRRGPAWDCGYPDPIPATQYTADSFAQPLRRVFSEVFLARERVHMPAPGDARPARIDIRLRDLVWELIYAPIEGWIAFASERMNSLQFLTIRQYLSLVFGALVALLLAVSLWP
ncbi:MAG: hydrogenase 4 subunit B [Hyphomicrobium sp.]|nr:hydrogenase 4 subunit B [Hyphomicrobium sp.]